MCAESWSRPEKAFRRAYEIRQAANETGFGLWESQSLLAKIECEGGISGGR